MPGPKSDKRWADALSRALHRESDGKGSKQWLEVIANKCVEAAAEGDMQAIKEVGDRMDGKPKQAVDMKHGPLDEVAEIFRYVAEQNDGNSN